MRAVEQALSRLDGVTSVSAGWWSDKATVVVRPDVTLTRDQLDAAVRKAGFRVVALDRHAP